MARRRSGARRAAVPASASRCTRAYDEARQQAALEEARDALLAVGRHRARGGGRGPTSRACSGIAVRSRMTSRRHLARAEELAGDSSLRRVGTRTRLLRRGIREHRGRERGGAGSRAEAALAMATSSASTSSALTRSRPSAWRRTPRATDRAFADMEQALEIALAADSPVAATIVNNLAVFATFAGDVRPRGRALHRGGSACRALRGRGERPLHPRQPHLDRLHARRLGARARAGGRVHRGVRSRLAAHEGVRRARRAGSDLPRSGTRGDEATSRPASRVRAHDRRPRRRSIASAHSRSGRDVRRAGGATRRRTRRADPATRARDRAPRGADPSCAVRGRARHR